MTSTRFSVSDVTIDIVGETRLSTTMVNALNAAHVAPPAESLSPSSQADITLQVKA